MNSDDLTLRVSTSTRVGRGYELSNTRVLGGGRRCGSRGESSDAPLISW